MVCIWENIAKEQELPEGRKKSKIAKHRNRDFTYKLVRQAEPDGDRDETYIEKVRDGNMGYLFENMEKMDIQLERRNTVEQRQRAEKAEQDKQNLYRILISTYRKQGMERKEVKKQLLTELKLEEKEIDNLIETFWK